MTTLAMHAWRFRKGSRILACAFRLVDQTCATGAGTCAWLVHGRAHVLHYVKPEPYMINNHAGATATHLVLRLGVRSSGSVGGGDGGLRSTTVALTLTADTIALDRIFKLGG